MTKQAADTKASTKAAEVAAPVVNVPKFKVTKTVTLPLSKWQLEVPKYLEITGAIFEGKQVSEQKGKVGDMEAAHLFRAIDLTTGEQCEVISGTVLMGTLNEAYPDDAYVGKQFMFTQHAVEGKRYKTYSVTEIEVEK
jgi:hypothetical protein